MYFDLCAMAYHFRDAKAFRSNWTMRFDDLNYYCKSFHHDECMRGPSDAVVLLVAVFAARNQ